MVVDPEEDDEAAGAAVADRVVGSIPTAASAKLVARTVRLDVGLSKACIFSPI
jgi:hypothetical protein